MKIKRLVMIGSLVVPLAMRPLRAQVASFQATIPFPFVVGSQTLPAGTYVVQRFLGKPKTSADVRVIVLEANDHHVYKVVITASGGAARAADMSRSKLIFTSFKGREYLNWVCIAGDAAVHQVVNIPAEIAAQGVSGEVIVTGLGNTKGK
jgi:hypothetical protein